MKLCHLIYTSPGPETGCVLGKSLTLKGPIKTAADDKFCDIFPSFRQK